MQNYLGIDLGAGSFDFIRGMQQDIANKTYAKREIPSIQDPETGMRKVIAIARELAEGYEIARIGACSSCGNAAYGGMKSRPPTMPAWEGTRIKKQLEDTFGCEVRFENDVDAGVIGEYAFGHKNPNMVWVYIGTGTSAGVFREGKLLRSAKGGHLEFGHTTLSPKLDLSPKAKELYENGAPCPCGGINHFESVVSGIGIRQVYDKAPEEITDARIWEEIGHNLGQALYNAIHSYGPDLIVFAGGTVLGAGQKMLDPAIKYLEAMRVRKSLLGEMPEIRLTKLGDDVTLLGTLAMAMSDQPY